MTTDSYTAAALAKALRDRHPHMTFLCEAIRCPYCHARVGEPCKTSNGQPTSFPHSGRFEDFRHAQ